MSDATPGDNWRDRTFEPSSPACWPAPTNDGFLLQSRYGVLNSEDVVDSVIAVAGLGGLISADERHWRTWPCAGRRTELINQTQRPRRWYHCDTSATDTMAFRDGANHRPGFRHPTGSASGWVSIFSGVRGSSLRTMQWWG